MTTTALPEKSLKLDGRGKNPNSRKNLKPGYHGQNNGQNGFSLTSRLKTCLNKPLQEPGKDATAGELLVHATLKAAIATKAVPFIEVWNRTEGKVPGDGVQVNFNEIKILVVYEDRKKLDA